MPNLNVLADVLGAVVIVGLAIGITAVTSKSLAKFFILPIILVWVHVYGNTVQELGRGPEWIRNHLHNTGVAGLSMIFALFFTLYVRRRQHAHLGSNRRRIEVARVAMDQVLYYWIISSIFGVVQEIVTVMIWDEDVKAAGYSGKLDWFDLSAYVIGALIATCNYLWFKPRILAKMHRQYRVCV